ncbi:MAG: hypothetical protein Ta2B_03830 [Termitinemataceae bacterium]|nr:MAG: hypothetical protein Ta2B_03830 [Termitinemataceae bacterium]
MATSSRSTHASERKLKQKIFCWFDSIDIVKKLYRAMIPENIRAIIQRNMTSNLRAIKTLSLLIIEYMKNSDSIYYEKVFNFLQKNKYGVFSDKFIEIFFDEKLNAYNFNNVLIPKISKNVDIIVLFLDCLLNHTLFNENYSKDIVLKVGSFINKEPYAYIDGDFKVTVEKNDVVIDAGANIGDFSAYAAYKLGGGGGACYAFEPVSENYEMLCKTCEINTNKFIPVKYGLGDKVCEIPITMNRTFSTIHFDKRVSGFKPDKKLKKEIIKITTIDKFVEENNIAHVDFIKADIEGAERDMLLGASNVLRTFAPKLAISTYHLPDDPQVLKNIILQANPKYNIMQLRTRLFAYVS